MIIHAESYWQQKDINKKRSLYKLLNDFKQTREIKYKLN